MYETDKVPLARRQIFLCPGANSRFLGMQIPKPLKQEWLRVIRWMLWTKFYMLLKNLIERLGYPVSDIEIGLAYHLLCRSRFRCWNIVSKVGLCRRDHGARPRSRTDKATTKQNSFCRHETIEMWRKYSSVTQYVWLAST